MNWSALDLKKASVLRKEVDQALRLVQQYVESDEQEKLAALIDSIESKSRDIEEFYSRNDDDERAILFEKQRIRLRRAVQSLKPTTMTHLNSGSAVSSPVPKTPLPHDRFLDDLDKNVNRSMIPDTTNTKSSAVRGNVDKHLPLSVSALSSPKKTSPTSSRTSKVKPIYAWENTSEDGGTTIQKERTIITTEEFGSYVPCTTPSLYMTENEEADAMPETYMDLQVVLTPAEFDVFVSRRKALRPEKKVIAKLASKTTVDNEFLKTSTPYVDPKRIQKELYRPANPDKWVSNQGFKISKA